MGAAGRNLYPFPAPDGPVGDDVGEPVKTFSFVEGGARVEETVTWSRRRFTGGSFLAVDSVPARPGRRTTLTLRLISTQGRQVDTVTLARTAGRAVPGAVLVDLDAGRGRRLCGALATVAIPGIVRSMLRTGTWPVSVRHALLALLSEGPTYGLQLRQEFEARTGEAWPLNVGQVYTTLQRLERDGYVEAVDLGDGTQKAYAITDDGRRSSTAG